MATYLNHNGASLGDQLREARNEAFAVRGEVGEIAAEVQRLMQTQVELARAEANESASHLTKSGIFAAAAGLFAAICSVFLFLAIMFALDTFLAEWLAALITAGIALLSAMLFALLARSQMKAFSPLPRRFMRSVQEDVEWARSLIKSNAT